MGAVAAVDGAARGDEDVTFLSEVEDEAGVEVDFRAPALGGPRLVVDLDARREEARRVRLGLPAREPVVARLPAPGLIQ